MEKYITFVLLSLLLSFSACNKDKVRTSVIGAWNCEETTEERGIRIYQVSITRNYYNASDSTGYIISNFHNLGTSVEMEVFVQEREAGKLEIVNSPSGYLFTGDGIIASDFSTIDWIYQTSDGFNDPLVRAKYY